MLDIKGLRLFFFYICFFIILISPLHGETHPFKTQIQEYFIDYKKAIFNTYASIEFTDSMEYKKMTNNECATHYRMTAFYSIDLIKKRIYSRIISFYLLDGINEKKRYVGMETDTPLKNIYFFSDYLEKQWNQLLIHKDESYVSFKATEWFIPLSINIYYDSNNYFPKQIFILSDDHNIDIDIKHSEHSGIYLMDELNSDVTLNFVMVKYHMETHITRSQYVLRFR